MKLYSKKYHRYVERQIHFGVGNSVHTACGLVLYSRHVMVNLHSDSDGARITDDIKRVTCKRCLATRVSRLLNLIAIEKALPTIFDHETLCGEEWLLKHALDVSRDSVDAQKLNINVGGKAITLSNKIKGRDRKQILRDFVKNIEYCR